MRKLCCTVQDQLIEPCVPLRDEAAAFDRGHHLARGAQLAGDFHRRRPRDRLDRAIEADLEKDIALDRVVHEG